MIKKIFKITGVVLLLLILVLLFNTFTYKSKQLQIAAIPVVEVPEQCAEHLAGAVRIKTVSDDIKKSDTVALKKLLDYLSVTFPLADSVLQKKIINGYSLLYKWEGSDASLKPIVLMGHMDVVPVADEQLKNWDFEPFGGEIKDGYICGRGTLDDKVNVVGLLETAEILLKEGFEPKRTVYFAFGHDEEIGGKEGAKKIAEYLQSKNVQAEFVMDEGMVITKGVVPGIQPDIALVGISEKGYLTVQLSVESQGGHSSMPAKETPIGILSSAIARLEQNPIPVRISEPVSHFLDYVGPEMPFTTKLAFANQWLLKSIILNTYQKSNSGNATVRTTTAPTIFKSGVKENVLPPRADAVINFRILPGETTQDVLAHIEKTVSDSRVKIHEPLYSNEAAEVSDIHSVGFMQIEKTARQVFPQTLVAPSLMLGATDVKQYAIISKNLFRFMPVPFDSEDLSRLHGNNERISIKAFKNCIRFYRQLIVNSCE